LSKRAIRPVCKWQGYFRHGGEIRRASVDGTFARKGDAELASKQQEYDVS
jgi:hypothetical protein